MNYEQDPAKLAGDVRAQTGVTRRSSAEVHQIRGEHFDTGDADGLDPATLAAAVSTNPHRAAQRRQAQARIDAAVAGESGDGAA